MLARKIVPWTYAAVYFTEAAVIVMLFTNVPVLLKQAFNMDWLTLTATDLGALAPILLHPVLGVVITRRQHLLGRFVLLGFALVAAGGAITSAISLATAASAGDVATGLSLGIAGATLINVAADSHIVLTVPKAQISRVNSRKRMAAIAGIIAGQGLFLLFVGPQVGVLAAWAPYLLVPPAFAIGSIILLLACGRSWNFLPLPRDPAGALMPRQPRETPAARGAPPAWPVIALVILITLACYFPLGFINMTWGNFLVDTYGAPAYTSYVVFAIISIPLQMLGAWAAGRVPRPMQVESLGNLL
jgi:hypothetical protein